MSHLLIIDARFYPDITDELLRGATAVLDEAGSSHERVSVPGVLEIPGVLAMAAKGESGRRFDGYVLLGCVIRGETSHYDIVANESAHAIMNLIIGEQLALGNGILTVEAAGQAWRRAKVDDKNKGGDAARAALAMIDARRALETRRG